MIPAPHNIRAKDGSALYRCRACNSEENLRWFNGTSCPVCSRPECAKELAAEWDEAFQALYEDEDEN